MGTSPQLRYNNMLKMKPSKSLASITIAVADTHTHTHTHTQIPQDISKEFQISIQSMWFYRFRNGWAY